VNCFLTAAIFIISNTVLYGQQEKNKEEQHITPSKKITIMEHSKEDSLAITETLTTYFKSIYEGDVVLLRGTFHPGTLLFGDVKGQPYAKTLDQYLDGVENRQSPKESGQAFKTEIISVDVVNSIAVAKVKVKMYAFHYHEFLSFHRIGGKWLIVNKMIADVNE
jgi:hypothetical protein